MVISIFQGFTLFYINKNLIHWNQLKTYTCRARSRHLLRTHKIKH